MLACRLLPLSNLDFEVAGDQDQEQGKDQERESGSAVASIQQTKQPCALLTQAAIR